MSRYLNTLCEFMCDPSASKSVEFTEDNTFRIYMLKHKALSFKHNVKSNHTHEIIHIKTDKQETDFPVYEKNFKGRYERANGRKLYKRIVYFVEFKFTYRAYAFYENYMDWSNL